MNPSEYVSIISFPGLGIGEFPVNRLAFRIFGLDVMWYGVIICFGIIVAFSYLAWRANQVGINFDNVLDYTLWTVPIAVLGARLYYVLFSLKYHTYHSFLEVISPRDGGLAIYGGVLVGALMVFLVARHKKQSFCMMGDMVVPGVMIAQAIGRWGNFVNQEAFGTNTTSIFGMISEGTTRYLQSVSGKLASQGIIVDPSMPVHPTFLYESVWCIIGFVLLLLHIKKKNFKGENLCLYVFWYGLGRFFIEGLRTDSLETFGGLRMSQLVALISVVVSL